MSPLCCPGGVHSSLVFCAVLRVAFWELSLFGFLAVCHPGYFLEALHLLGVFKLCITGLFGSSAPRSFLSTLDPWLF